MKTEYPYTGEASRFRDMFHDLLDIGATFDIDTNGELIVRSRDPIPTRLRSEIRYFKSSLIELLGEERIGNYLSGQPSFLTNYPSTVRASPRARKVPQIAE